MDDESRTFTQQPYRACKFFAHSSNVLKYLCHVAPLLHVDCMTSLCIHLLMYCVVDNKNSRGTAKVFCIIMMTSYSDIKKIAWASSNMRTSATPQRRTRNKAAENKNLCPQKKRSSFCKNVISHKKTNQKSKRKQQQNINKHSTTKSDDGSTQSSYPK